MVTLRISARNISGHRGRKRQGRDMQNRVRRVPHSDMVLCMAGGGGIYRHAKGAVANTMRLPAVCVDG